MIHLVKNAFKNHKGAVDLSSIMVGVIVIGILGGVIAASVLGVIPWAQNNAAKSNLGAIQTAQSAAVSITNQAPGYRTIEYLTGENPAGTAYLSADSTNKLNIGVSPDRLCYVAVSKSDTGAYFYNTNQNSTIREYKTDDANPNECAGTSLPAVVDALNN